MLGRTTGSTMTILTHPNNIPFTIALGVLVLLFLFELASTVMGNSSFIGDADADFDVSGGDGFLNDALSWLHWGKVPIMASLIAFTSGFGLAGMCFQVATGNRFPAWVAAIPAFIIGLLSIRGIGALIGKVGLRDETTAIASDSFVGQVATVTLGEARFGAPSQAKFRDTHGQTHYVLVEPQYDDQSFAVGEEVILVERQGPKFLAVSNSADALSRLHAEVEEASK